MKDDKRKPASNRQRRQAVRLGVELSSDDTVHSACQKLNSAAQAEALAKTKLPLIHLAEFLSTPMPYSELRFDKNGRRYWVPKHTPDNPVG